MNCSCFTIFALLALAVSAASASSLRKGRAIEINTNDPQQFIQDVNEKSRDIEKRFYDLIGVRDAADDASQIGDFLEKVEEISKEAEEISNIAHSFDLTQIKDDHVKNMLQQIWLWGAKANLGPDTLSLLLNRKSVEELLTEPSIAEYYDIDSKVYSIKELETIWYWDDMVDLDELRYYWKEKNKILQKASQKHFFDVVETIQQNAKASNMTGAEYWFFSYSEERMEQIDAVIKQLKPFYQLIHAFMRQWIFERFGAGVIKPNGPIPGDLSERFYSYIWGDQNPIESEFPYDDLPKYDEIFVEQGFDAKQLVELAEKFYESLGFDSFNETFWENNIYEAHNDEDFECPAIVTKSPTLAYCNQTDVTAYTVHHQKLAKIHGSLLRKDLPPYLSGDNGLESAIGTAIAIAAQSVKHFKSNGIASDFEYSSKDMLNSNIREAFNDMSNVFYSYVRCKVLVDVLNGKVEKKSFNKYFWHVWDEYAGEEPPFDRTDDSMDLPYSVYLELSGRIDLVASITDTIWGFQLYRAACQRAGHTGLIENCDFYGSKDVGSVLKEMLSLGRAKPVDEIIKLLDKNYEKLDAKAMLEYYEPAQKWLKNYIDTKGLKVGWEHSKRSFSLKLKSDENEAAAFAKEASDKIYKLFDDIAQGLFLNEDKAFDRDTEFWLTSATAIAATELKDISLQAKTYDTHHFKDKTLKKAIKQLTKIADVFVLGTETSELMFSKQSLANISIDQDITKYNTEDEDAEYVALYPDIQNVFLHSNDDAELEYYWKQWRKTNNEYCRLKLTMVFDAFKNAANILEIPVSDFWFKGYHSKFVKQMENVIDEIHPLYKKLHAYVKLKLNDKRDEQQIYGAIPDHLVEKVLLQIWTNDSIVEDDFQHDDLLPDDEITKRENYDALKLLHNADDFYKSLGFTGVEEDFWTERLKPQVGSESITECHATIYDFTPKVYMKYCENVNYKKFLQAHGYLGRIHYALEKKDLPGYFFNSHFLEYPVGEAAILSASAPKHWEAIGVPDVEYTDSIHLNRLIRMGIHTFFKIHKYFVHTKVVEDYLKGAVQMDKLNKHYWKLMIQYAGIEPPQDRYEDDFDFPFEFYTDIENNHQLKKFTSDVLGYQIYEALCKLAEHEGDLNQCDFFGSVQAGEALKKMMRLGSSKSWKKVLQVLIPDMEKLSASALLKYYEPLANYLDEVDLPSDTYDTSDKKYFESESFLEGW